MTAARTGRFFIALTRGSYEIRHRDEKMLQEVQEA
jgi:hypothetical protein